MGSIDVYEIVTNRIIDELSKGIIPWKKPWSSREGAVKHANGKAYSMLNQFLLGCSGEWLSYAQAEAEGGKVKKGEKGRIVVFWKWLEKKLDEEDENGEQKIQRIPFLKYSTVFEVSQCEGIKRKYDKVRTYENDADEDAEKLFENYTTRESIITHKNGEKAFYNKADDSITVPALERFVNSAEYYSTIFHEAVHSTGAKNRLAREGVVGSHYFGTEDYSKEELVAEIGASMILNLMGLETVNSFTNNVAYINNWIEALKNDKRLIVSASSKAEKAVKFIMGEEVKEEVA